LEFCFTQESPKQIPKNSLTQETTDNDDSFMKHIQQTFYSNSILSDSIFGDVSNLFAPSSVFYE
jgi:hypothetical protein